MESTIKWQTGEPKTHGRYLVQTDKDGLQIAFWSAYVQTWSLYHNSEIVAWCKLSDIEPYKEAERPFKTGDLVVENRIVGVVVELQNKGVLKVFGSALIKMHFTESMCRKATDEEALAINARWREQGFYYDIKDNKFKRYKEEQPWIRE